MAERSSVRRPPRRPLGAPEEALGGPQGTFEGFGSTGLCEWQRAQVPQWALPRGPWPSEGPPGGPQSPNRLGLAAAGAPRLPFCGLRGPRGPPVLRQKLWGPPFLTLASRRCRQRWGSGSLG